MSMHCFREYGGFEPRSRLAHARRKSNALSQSDFLSRLDFI